MTKLTFDKTNNVCAQFTLEVNGQTYKWQCPFMRDESIGKKDWQDSWCMMTQTGEWKELLQHVDNCYANCLIDYANENKGAKRIELVVDESASDVQTLLVYGTTGIPQRILIIK